MVFLGLVGDIAILWGILMMVNCALVSLGATCVGGNYVFASGLGFLGRETLQDRLNIKILSVMEISDLIYLVFRNP